ncbi:MAG TPA: hypothetical protein VFB92_14400 [Vicinamibacterales bacterium]|nr:hypothetical protein [Vicinamibacterales bacterium]
MKRAQYLFRRFKTAEKSLYFRLRDSDTGRVLLRAANMARSPREIRHRTRVAAPYLAQLDSSTQPFIDPRTGYSLLSLNTKSELGHVLPTCRQLFEFKKEDIGERLSGIENWSAERREKFLARKRSFLRYLLDDEDLLQHPEIVDFALSDRLLGAATRYLGMVPYLSRVDLMYSLPRGSGDNIASQLFHLDHEGVTQVKAFVHLFDVGDREGPFTFIPADATMRIVNDIRRLRKRRGSHHDVELRRYSDEEIAAVDGTKDIVTVKGPTGTGVAVDTSRCLHLGSRVDEGAFRLCLYLQYCTTHELTNVYDVARFTNDPVRHLAVKHSTEPGRARATDYTHQIMGG